MARYTTIDTSSKFLRVVISDQLLPGTFENGVSVKAKVSVANVKRTGRSQHALKDPLDHELDIRPPQFGLLQIMPPRTGY